MKKKHITFSQLAIDKRIIKALEAEAITQPTEIQEKAIPEALKGHDVIGRAKTGSGKTLAFSVPIIDELLRNPAQGVQALILAPTRELAKQVAEEFEMCAGDDIKVATIYGGVAYEPQFEALKKAHVVIGTPGRVLDHLEKKTLVIDGIQFFVLDEADRMLDMGFIEDITKILQYTPIHKQNFFFSATMPGKARDLAESFMNEPIMVGSQELYVSDGKLEEYYVDVDKFAKPDMLAEVLRREDPKLALVFVNSRLFTDKVADFLKKKDFKVGALHGGHSQNKREQTVEHFDAGKVHVLVATDVAARGLDIDDVSHVVNFDVPDDRATYTHRIGRTARAGREGKAITLLCRDEHGMFSRIEGDSLRNIYKYEIDYEPKKVRLLEGRGGDRRGGHRGNGPRRGPPGRGGPRRHGGRGNGRPHHKKRPRPTRN